MEIKIIITSRKASYHAEGRYIDGKVYVDSGVVSSDFANHIKGGTFAQKYRNNPKYINKNGEILQTCVFNSLSTAAQFVSGISTNGKKAWKTLDGRYIGEVLEDKEAN